MSNICVLPYNIFNKGIFNKTVNKNIPIQGQIDLTYKCNLKCVHCYIGKRNKASKEMSFREVCSVLDQLAASGCLWLALTGGEAMIRRDFKKIYLYAKSKGFLITLLSNGTLIDRRMADLLHRYPPFGIEISIYGVTKKTYESITRVNGSFEKCFNGIKLLHKYGIKFKVKTALMTLNKHEFKAIERLADKFKTTFRYDPMITSDLDGSIEPCGYRLTPEEIVRYDLSNKKRLQEWKKFYKIYYGQKPADSVYMCSAGKGMFNIDPSGRLGGCVLSRLPNYNILQGSFREGFFKELPRVYASKIKLKNRTNKCYNCSLYVLCGCCPGWNLIEKTAIGTPVAFMCKTAKLRFKKIRNLMA
ncbi:MAG: radical SAM protein [Candidatus Omnitrophica bacterium]|nr:radical SAM protein [Candidatus Omnitrophota bacterium]